MSSEWLGASARYNRWMNDKLFGLAATLSDEARKRDSGAFFKSIHGTLNHLLLADRVWLGRFNGLTLPNELMAPGGIRSLDQELYADFDDLRRERASTDEELLRPGSPGSLRSGSRLHWSTCVGATSRSRLRSGGRWRISSTIRPIIAVRSPTLLTQQGCDPGSTDLFAMLREEAARPSVS